MFHLKKKNNFLLKKNEIKVPLFILNENTLISRICESKKCIKCEFDRFT